MRKVFTLAFTLIITISMINSQVFIGGSLEFNIGSGKDISGNTSVKSPSELSFGLSPRIGFQLNDNFTMGIDVGILTLNETTPNFFGVISKIDNITAWSAGLFARYNLLKINSFSLLLEGATSIGEGKVKSTVGSTTNNGDPLFVVDLSILPVLSYNLTDRFSIEAKCDFLRLAFTSVTITDADDSNDKGISNNLKFGVNPSAFNANSPIALGVIYRF